MSELKKMYSFKSRDLTSTLECLNFLKLLDIELIFLEEEFKGNIEEFSKSLPHSSFYEEENKNG